MLKEMGASTENVIDLWDEANQTWDLTVGKIGEVENAGMSAATQMGNLANAANAYVTAGVNAGEASTDLAARVQAGRDAFVQAAVALGMTADEAMRLAEELIVMPTEYDLALNVESEQAEAALSRYQSAMAGLHTDLYTTFSNNAPEAESPVVSYLATLDKTKSTWDSFLENNAPEVEPQVSAYHDALTKTAQTFTATLKAQDEASPVISSVDAQLNALHNKRVTTYVVTEYTSTGSRSYAGGLTVATGGYITGPGTSTSDSILSWLSNGEFVMRAAAVARLGLDRLQYMNATGRLPAFAGGGPVSLLPAPQTGPSVTVMAPGQDLGPVLQALNTIAALTAEGREIRMDTGALVGATGRPMNANLGIQAKWQARGGR
jgi:hypothetical protein